MTARSRKVRDGVFTSISVYLVVLVIGIISATAAAISGVNPAAFSLSLFACSLLLGIIIEAVAAYRPKRGVAPTRTVEWLNSTLNLLLGFSIGGVIYALVRWVQLAFFGVNPDYRANDLGPMWLQALAAFLMMDLARYFIHRLQHRIPLLWRFHKTHHTIGEVRLANVLFAHPFDYVPRLVFPVYLPMALGMMPKAVIIAQGVITLLGLMSHTSVAPRFGLLNLVFATSEVHRWHHNVVPEAGGDRNYGIGTILWDRLFGTFYMDQTKEAPDTLGTDVAPPRRFVETISLSAHEAALRTADQSNREVSLPLPTTSA